MIVQRYPEPFIAPMRAELSRLGFEDLRRLMPSMRRSSSRGRR